MEEDFKKKINDGYIPKDLKETMSLNGHEGDVWFIKSEEYIKPEKNGTDESGNQKYRDIQDTRYAVGYKMQDIVGQDEGGENIVQEASHIVWYNSEEVRGMLNE